MFTLDLGEVQSVTNIINGNGGGQSSIFGQEQIEEYAWSKSFVCNVSSNFYDDDTSNYLTVTNWTTFTDSLIFYKNTIIGLAEPEFLSNSIRLWITTAKFESELPEGDSGAHFMNTWTGWTKLSLDLDPGEDPTSWTFGKTRLAYKSNNIHSEYCNPPFTWVYMIPVIKQHTQAPYVLQLLIVQVTAQYNEDGTYQFSTQCQFQNILETSYILGTTPSITLAALSRFDDVDDYVYGLCGVDSKIMESAFWCLDATSFKYNIKTAEFTLGSNIYSRTGWGSIYSTAKMDTTKYFYVPDLGEFRPDLGETTQVCTLVVDTLELIDYDDSGWGDREKDMHKLSKYRYYMNDVWYTGDNYYQYVDSEYTNALNWENISDGIFEFGKFPRRWNREKRESTYYPYKDQSWGNDGIPEVDDLTRVDILGYEDTPQKEYCYATKIGGVLYIAIFSPTEYTVTSEYVPYSGMLMHRIVHSNNQNSSIFGGFALAKQCMNVTNPMNEFNLITSKYKNGESTWHKLKGTVEAFYPRPNCDSYYDPYLVRASEITEL